MMTPGCCQFTTNDLRFYLTATNNHQWYYIQAQKSDSLNFILVVLRTLRSFITSSRGLVLPPWILVLNSWVDSWWEKGAILGNFWPILASPRWLTSSEFNHIWYVNSLLMGNYYCGVRNFQNHSFALGGRNPA